MTFRRRLRETRLPETLLYYNSKSLSPSERRRQGISCDSRSKKATSSMTFRDYFLKAGFAALVSVGSYYGYQHGSLPDWYWEARLPDGIEPLDVSDTEQLKKILFGGEPWLIQCYTGLPYGGQHLPAPYRIHKAFKVRCPAFTQCSN